MSILALSFFGVLDCRVVVEIKDSITTGPSAAICAARSHYKLPNDFYNTSFQ
jgi:hypothetical protein